MGSSKKELVFLNEFKHLSLTETPSQALRPFGMEIVQLCPLSEETWRTGVMLGVWERAGVCLGVEMVWKLCLKEADTFKYFELTVFPGLF